MPTGYTALVAEGQITTLRDFALTCARSMGALIRMRDEPYNTAIPTELGVDVAHYDDDINDYLEELAVLDRATPEELQTLFEEENAEIRARRERALHRDAVTKERYEAMIAKVEAWQGAPGGLKEFMLQQLVDSIKYDIPVSDYHEAENESFDEWLDDTRKYLLRSIERTKHDRQEEIERTRECNEWLQQLHRSLEGV
jgi:hypothetical protein